MGRSVPKPDSEVNFWSNLTKAEREVFEKMLPADIRPKIAGHLEHAPCGLVVIIGPPGTGKTWLMAWLALVRSVAGKKLSCHAPTNAATSVFFGRYVSILEGNNWRDDFLAIRHYGAHLEVAIVVKFLLAQHGEHQWNTSPQYQSYGTSEDADVGQWAPGGSAAAAALYVMGKISSVQCGAHVLRNLRGNEVVKMILDLIQKAVDDHIDSVSEDIPQDNPHPDDFRNDLDADDEQGQDGEARGDQADGTPQYNFSKEHIESRLKGRSLGGLVRELMLQILWRASAVFSTTHVGASQLVKKFTKVANEYFLDEAAATTIPEAAQIWRNDRPFVMGGDPYQLLPVTLSAGTRYAGTDHIVNPLAPQHKLSLLRQAMLNSWPCLVLKYQRRMVVGLFDISKDIFYQNWGLTYGTQCVLDEHPVAQHPRGKVMPVFIHVPRSDVSYSEVSRLRSNKKMLTVLVRTLNRLIQGASLGPQDIAIITPYTSQEIAILKALGSNCVSVSDVPTKILFTTADRAQGNERKVVIFIAVNTTLSGAGFLWDENRMNVISTRASDFFLVVGDIAVDKKRPSVNVKQSCEKMVDNKLGQWLQFFRRNGRLANRDGASLAERQKVTWLENDPATFAPKRFAGSPDN